MATEVSSPEQILAASAEIPSSSSVASMSLPIRRAPPAQPDVLTTVYSFPTFEPLRFEHYPAQHLRVPLRRDILHRAITFEGDSERQGTASTKWRDEVRHSGAKIRPQKGTGNARLGDRRSPMLRGGGVAFGPHPRDFSTKLPKKIYDLAWRTALSYRYSRGELLVVEGDMEFETNEPRWFSKIMQANAIGSGCGRSMIITKNVLPNLWAAVAGAGQHGKIRSEKEVDVKNLLELGRVIIEKRALDSILAEHSSDLEGRVKTAVGI